MKNADNKNPSMSKLIAECNRLYKVYTSYLKKCFDCQMKYLDSLDKNGIDHPDTIKCRKDLSTLIECVGDARNKANEVLAKAVNIVGTGLDRIDQFEKIINELDEGVEENGS